MRIQVGDEYRYKDHIGTVHTVERLNNEIFLIVQLPTMPEGQQWLTTHGPETDFTEDYIQ